MRKYTSENKNKKIILIIVSIAFFISLLFRPNGIVLAGTPTPTTNPGGIAPNPQNSTLPINFSCNNCQPAEGGTLIKLYVCNESTCAKCGLNNTYPTSNPGFSCNAPTCTQNSPGNTLAQDDVSGNINFVDSDGASHSGYWDWDLGSSKTGNFSIRWLARLESYLPAFSYTPSVVVTSYVSNDGSSWTTIRSVTLVLPEPNTYTPWYNDTIKGTYRYISINISSTTYGSASVWVDYARVNEDLTATCLCNSSSVSSSPSCNFTNSTTCNYGTSSAYTKACAFQNLNLAYTWACQISAAQTFTYKKNNGCSCGASAECYSGCCNVTSLCGVDCNPPTYNNNNTNTTTTSGSDPVLIYANWTDDYGLSYAWLWTNETGGAGKNYTGGTYGSPHTFSSNPEWSNFTWTNSSTMVGTVIAWKIYANDTSNNVNVTAQGTFTVVVDAAFSVAMPTSFAYTNITATSEATATLTTPTNISFNFSTEPQYWIQPYAGGSSSTPQNGAAQPIFLIDATGNVPINISLRLNETLPSGLAMCGNSTCTGTCTYTTSACTAISTNYVKLVGGLSQSNSLANITLYANLTSTSVSAGEIGKTIYINSTSS